MRSLHEPRPRRLWLRLAVSFATLVLVAGIGAASLHRYRHTRLDALRAEHQRIESDLRQVKASAASIKPVIVLENDDTRVIVAPDQQSTPVYY